MIDLDEMRIREMNWKAKWIKPKADMKEVCPIFSVCFMNQKEVKEAKLYVTALGVYEAKLNGEKVGEFVLAPGWTSYQKRLQYQCYDVTALVQEKNDLSITVGKGWYRSPMPGFTHSTIQDELRKMPAGCLAQLEILYRDGEKQIVLSDEFWKVGESRVRFSEIYDGEVYDASFEPVICNQVEVFEGPYHTLIPQQGEEVREQERIQPLALLVTPKGERVIDFGQELTGYVEIKIEAPVGQIVKLSHAEVLDKEGNFYTENYRSAKSQYHYICGEGGQTYKPKFTFYGFRYIRLDEYPGGVDQVKLADFTAIVVHSEMKRTGYLSCSNPLLNQLFENIVWGQKGNFVDVPTDCPQRDERLGWTGDAQVFIKTACLNYQVETFFTKWLADLAADQGEDGYVGHVIPDLLNAPFGSAAWGDAATICPFELYRAYGNKEILSSQFESMKKWVDYITHTTTKEFLWCGGEHYGDWLGLDAHPGSYKGASREELIATAFYAHSTSLVIKAGHLLNKEVKAYESLYEQIKKAFQTEYPVYYTQTECVLAAHFKLALNCQQVAHQLAQMIEAKDIQLETGFVGTPYLLHVLSDYGYTKLAYSLLLREKYPSWLYPVTKGATTIWEHWDGIMENGDFWSKDMNSYNHYAYGAVADWIYTVAAGIQVIEEYPGYEKVRISPHPDNRLDWLKVRFESKHGPISSEWKKMNEKWQYQITTPVDAIITIDDQTYEVKKGTYLYYSLIK